MTFTYQQSNTEADFVPYISTVLAGAGKKVRIKAALKQDPDGKVKIRAIVRDATEKETLLIILPTSLMCAFSYPQLHSQIARNKRVVSECVGIYFILRLKIREMNISMLLKSKTGSLPSVFSILNRTLFSSAVRILSLIHISEPTRPY